MSRERPVHVSAGQRPLHCVAQPEAQGPCFSGVLPALKRQKGCVLMYFSLTNLATSLRGDLALFIVSSKINKTTTTKNFYIPANGYHVCQHHTGKQCSFLLFQVIWKLAKSFLWELERLEKLLHTLVTIFCLKEHCRITH